MSRKKKVEEPVIRENISVEALDDVMGDRYGIYAKYVIQDRAIPDARDGLKPVQRRIIYSMWANKNTSAYKTRKCAKIVGDVIGKYHPHGDTSVYEALARMSQDWKVRMPLITFQGNNGSIDGDIPAAYRYTEAKLSALADELVRDLNKNAVDKILTYDDTEYEPVVLPARFPNLLVNGAEGIAVAMATEIPPHNLRELIEAVIYRIRRVRVEPLDLMEFIKGPDFPTGGVISSSEGLKNIYATGHGRIEVAAKAEIVRNEDGVNKIVITEIPYKAVKINIVHEIDEIRHKKVIEGIIEVRDESDRHGLKIVVDCKKSVNPDAILKYLMTKTGLTSSYTANMVAIVDGHPRTLNILEYIDCYIAHQVDVVTRVSQYNLDKNKARLEIVDGLIKAIAHLDEVIRIIKKSNDKADAKAKLAEAYKFSEAQSEAIVMMPLYKLSHTDMSTLNQEKKNLDVEIKRLKEILSDREVLNREIIKDLRVIQREYSNPRRTEIREVAMEEKVFDQRDLINKEDVMVCLTRDGYIKRSSLKSFKSSEESLPGVKEGDVIIYNNQCNTEDYLIAFTEHGNFIVIPVHEIPEIRWKEEGKQLSYHINYNAMEDRFVRAFTLKSFRKDLFFILVSRNGQIKRTAMADFYLTRCNRLYTAFRLLNTDRLVDVAISTGADNIMLFMGSGEAVYYPEEVLTPIGPKAGGVKAAKLNKTYIAAMLVYQQDEKNKILIITDHGHYRVFDKEHIAITKRLNKPTLIMPSFKGEPHKIMGVKKFNRSEGELHLLAISQAKGLVDLKIDDFYFTPIEKYAKTNLGIAKRDTLLYLYSHGEVVNPKLVSTYKPKPVSEKPANEPINNEKKPAKYTQISIFDEDNDEQK
ncbi:MAG: DNA topoisomerase 4 subunit A [Bacilli bacterium]|nr:DNA topoisomerase 4 subunit A [Bacilli bacterium]